MIKQLDTLMKKLHFTFSDINRGGCCTVASYMANALENSEVKTKIYLINSFPMSNTSLDVIRKKIYEDPNRTGGLPTFGEWTDNGLDFNHVVVAVTIKDQEYILDVERGCERAEDYWAHRGQNRIFGLRPIDGELTNEEASLLSETKGWNNQFDRRQLGPMREMMTETTSQLQRKA